jgi:hypothetical protein
VFPQLLLKRRRVVFDIFIRSERPTLRFMQYVLTSGNPRDFHTNMYEIDGPINIVFIKVYSVL